MATNLGEYYRGLEVATAALQGRQGAAPRAAAVLAAATGLFATTERHEQLACRAGCSHCCHFPVGITYGEALLLAAALADDAVSGAAIRASAAATEALPWSALVGQPCPLLAADRCRHHASRPLPCRALGSTDADACAQALTGHAAVPRDEAAFWRGLGAAAALAAEPPGGARELRSALAALLARPADPAAAFRAARTVGDRCHDEAGS
ncbi:MAG: YkgJ family cysteine cluster protein [Planctomycetes bacterium]|jgi:hypothetical protein|nr:YkgJ family cysteine cluster protein [Planctomycetota bacterium]